MNRKLFKIFMMASVGLAAQAHAQTLRPCTTEERNSDAPFFDANEAQEGSTPLPYDEDVAAHRLFTLPVLNYTRRTAPAHFPFSLSLLIDEIGEVVCLSPSETPDDPENAYPQRQAVYAAATNWRYVPFLVDDKPHKFWITETIPEQVFLPKHVAMPKGNLSGTIIRLNGWWGEVTLTGNGKGVYRDRWADNEKDTSRIFTVSPGEVAALIERLRSADAWSLERSYIVRFVDDYTAPETLSLNIDGQTKTVSYHNSDHAGMPQAMIAAIKELERLVDLSHSIHQRPDFDHPPIPVIPAPPIPIRPKP